MTAWTDTVKKTFKQGRLSNPSYQFKDALKDAKKFYKKGEALAVSAVKKTGKVAFKVKKGISKKLRKSMKKAKGLTKKAITFKKRKGGMCGKCGKDKKKGGMGCNKDKKMKGGETYEQCVAKCEDSNGDEPGALEHCISNC
jgi:hypothetical protein